MVYEIWSPTWEMGNEGVVIEEIDDDVDFDNDTVEKSTHNKAMLSQRSPSDEYYQQFTILQCDILCLELVEQGNHIE